MCDGSVYFVSQNIPWQRQCKYNFGSSAATYNMLGAIADGLMPGPF